MIPFEWIRAKSVDEAVHWLGKGGVAIAGGTNLVDHLKNRILAPKLVVDINHLPFKEIRAAGSGGLHIGSLVSNNTLAQHEVVRKHYPVLTRALLAGASGQIRNMASVGGNLLQRTRCPYFYDTADACNKRQPGSGCAALKGSTREAALFGASSHCVATYPSDMANALMMYDATVELTGPQGQRSVPIAHFYRLPGEHPEQDNVRHADEIITGVNLPAPHSGPGLYLKVRERASYAFALVSLAATAALEGGKVKSARIVLGGVAPQPWRLEKVEHFLHGRALDGATAEAAGKMATQGAVPHADNHYKLVLIERLVRRGLLSLATGRSSS